MKWNDIISALVLIVVSIVVFFASDRLEAKTRMDIGPDFMPKLVAALTFLLSSLLLAQAVQRNMALRAHQMPDVGRGPVRQGDLIERYADWISLLLILAYTIVFEPLGFVLSTTIFLFLQFIVMSRSGERRYIRFALVAGVVSTASYYVFLRLFYVFLPAGLLG
ncbi:putative tricarboxylic transport membrane protein [Aminobacter aminovorans]|uniref:Tripartite tricarboxylate transporter TctB family n=1 Tax=Aminobacter aminovorans TaxID=83263 RepID=A0A381IJU1_AMIAI|nr:tripartite tricarboxylate transporter TctB family protein [Aminobacter aminovorans]TCS25029.1 putative tricarboxylic transport membrane protein [Aminobacter aminovorans]SUY28516.1 Tripartite tricarboxylate transporter TctB family [Aminobacter aminovorans]